MAEDKILEVMNKIEQFYFEDGEDSGEQVFNRFASKHAHLFDADFDALDGENKLEYTDVYKEYQELFEKKIEDLIKQCDIQVDKFFDLLKANSKDNDDTEMFVTILLSLCEYENFVDMMKAYKREHSK